MRATRLLNVVATMLLVCGAGGASGLARNLTNSGGAGAQSERRALVPGTPVARVIADRRDAVVPAGRDAGEFVHVFIYQRGVNVAAKLVGPDGKTLLDADSPNSTQEAEWITHVAAASGEYVIEVAPARKGGLPGRYEIAIEERRKTAARDESRLSAQRAFTDGTRLFGEKDYTAAAGKYQEAAVLYRQSGRRLEEAVTLNCVARSYVSLNDNRTAIERFKEALSIYREAGDEHGLGFTEHEIGLAYFNSSGYDDARSHFEQALDARRKAGYGAGQAMTARALGAVYSSVGQQEKAIEYFEQAVTISRAEHLRSEEARALGNLGIANSLLGRPEKAIEYFEAALAVSREIHDRTIEGSTPRQPWQRQPQSEPIRRVHPLHRAAPGDQSGDQRSSRRRTGAQQHRQHLRADGQIREIVGVSRARPGNLERSQASKPRGVRAQQSRQHLLLAERVRQSDRVRRAGAGDLQRDQESRGRGTDAEQSRRRVQRARPLRQSHRLLRTIADHRQGGQEPGARGASGQQPWHRLHGARPIRPRDPELRAGVGPLPAGEGSG